MARCDVCGNEYDLTFSVHTHDGHDYTFDSVECAAMRIAPECGQCGCRVLGHGIQADTGVFCCASCARQSGVDAARDNTVSA